MKRTLCLLLCLAVLPLPGCAGRDRKEQELAAPSGKGGNGKAVVVVNAIMVSKLI